MDTDIRLNRQILPKIHEADHFRSEEGFVHPDRIMDVNVLLYVDKGRFEIFEEGEKYIVEEGNLFFLKKGLHHWGETKCTPQTVWHYVHFDIPSAEESIPLPKLTYITHSKNLVNKLDNLIESYKDRSESRKLYAPVILQEILLDIYAESEEHKPIAGDSARARLVEDYLTLHINEPFDSLGIEKHMNLSYKYINELFKRVHGRTIQQYHTEIRMERAERLLAETTQSVAEISEQLGFPEPFYFSNVFKKHTGLSPANYRKKIRI